MPSRDRVENSADSGHFTKASAFSSQDKKRLPDVHKTRKISVSLERYWDCTALINAISTVSNFPFM